MELRRNGVGRGRGWKEGDRTEELRHRGQVVTVKLHEPQEKHAGLGPIISGHASEKLPRCACAFQVGRNSLAQERFQRKRPEIELPQLRSFSWHRSLVSELGVNGHDQQPGASIASVRTAEL